jgi:hypothetical protein
MTDDVDHHETKFPVASDICLDKYCTLVSDKELEAFLEVFYFLSHQIVLMFIRMQIDMAANGMSCRYEKGIISKTPLM